MPPFVASVSVSTAYLDGLRACPLAIRVTPVAAFAPTPRSAVSERRAAMNSAVRAVGGNLRGQQMNVVGQGDPGEPIGDLAKLPLLDLPIAVGILVIAGEVEVSAVEGTLFLGELGFDGSLRGTRSVLALLRGLVLRGHHGRVVVPLSALRESVALRGLAGGLDVRGATSLREVVEHLRGTDPLVGLNDLAAAREAPAAPAMLSVPEGMEMALEIAAAGGIPLLALGNTGRNDAALARWLCALLPPLKLSEQLEHAAILSVMGLGTPAGHDRPVRVPHFTVSHGGMFASSAPTGARPGETSFAHHGVLVLSDVGAFPRSILAEVVRGKEHDLDHGFPARTRWLATSPLCYCGGTRAMTCACKKDSCARFLTRLMDLPVYPAAMVVPVTGDPHMASPVASAARVKAARAFTMKRAHRAGMIPSCPEEVWGRMDARAPLSEECRALLDRAMVELLHPGAELVTKRIARTIADLAAHLEITFDDMEKALHLAPFQIKLPV